MSQEQSVPEYDFPTPATPTDSFVLVREFNEAFGVRIADQPCLPGMTEGLKNELYRLRLLLGEQARYWHVVCSAYNNSPVAMRMHLMLEELGEVVEAVLKEDMINLLKEFNDQRIVNDGSVQVFGLESLFHAAMQLTHKANMSKLVNGKPVKNAVGRIQKGPNYKPADLSPLFAAFAAEGKKT